MQEFLDFAKQIAQKSGQIMKENFDKGMSIQWKQDTSPVTIADTSINELVIHEVRAKFPDHGVLGEEASFGTDKEYLWVVDPVDGTMPFSHGLPTSVFSIALVKSGETQVAVVQEPFSDHQYTAVKGQGAFRNGQPLRVNDQAEFGPQVFIEVGARPMLGQFDALKLLGQLIKSDVRASKNYSAIYYSLPVLSGHFAASFVFLSYPWDGAALSLIAEEAGGKVTDFKGNKRQWDKEGEGILISNGHIHDKLLALLQATRHVEYEIK